MPPATAPRKEARDPAMPVSRQSTQNSRIRSPGALLDSCARGTDTWQRAGARFPRRRSRGAVRPLRHSAAPGGRKESRQRCAARSAPRGSPRPAPPREIHAPPKAGCSSRPARAGGSPRRHSAALPRRAARSQVPFPDGCAAFGRACAREIRAGCETAGWRRSQILWPPASLAKHVCLQYTVSRRPRQSHLLSANAN